MIITVEVMKKILESVPDDFELYYCTDPIKDAVEIDVSGKKIILKS